MNKNEKLILRNTEGAELELSVWSPFFVEKISGVNSITNVINTTKSMNQDGNTQTSKNLDIRNILIDISILKDKEVNKNKFLNFISFKNEFKLFYYKVDKVKFIYCTIEKITDNQDYSNKFTLSLLCHDPYWHDELDTKKELAVWQKNLEFDLEVKEDEGLEFERRSEALIVNVKNTGNVPCGLILEFIALGTVQNPSILDVNTRQFIRINYTMKAGERLLINTIKMNKKVTLIRNDEEINAFRFIVLDSDFLQLNTGDNLFRYDAGDNLDNLEINIYFNPNYLGV